MHQDVTRSAIESALAEAVNDGIVGKLETQPDSADVKELSKRYIYKWLSYYCMTVKFYKNTKGMRSRRLLKGCNNADGKIFWSNSCYCN